MLKDAHAIIRCRFDENIIRRIGHCAKTSGFAPASPNYTRTRDFTLRGAPLFVKVTLTFARGQEILSRYVTLNETARFLLQSTDTVRCRVIAILPSDKKSSRKLRDIYVRRRIERSRFNAEAHERSVARRGAIPRVCGV